MKAGWFSEYYARHKELPPLGEVMDEFFGAEPSEEGSREELDAAKARAWNGAFAAIWQAQQAAAAKPKE